MKVALFAATLGVGLLSSMPASAQVVRAEIILGNSYPRERVVHVYERPRRAVAVHRYAPRVIVVERFHRGRGHYKHYRNNDYRRIRAWYDRDRSVYYDGFRPGLREVTIYLAGGRYYDDYYHSDRYRDNDRYRDDDRDDRYRDVRYHD
jgi:hypothetical protein